METAIIPANLTRQELEQKLNELQQRIEEMQAKRAFQPNWLERFLGFCDTTPKTQASYTTGLKKFLEYLNQEQISNPDTDDVIAYKHSLLERYSPNTVSLYMTACRLFFQWTAQRGLYPNIAIHIKGAKVSRKHKKDALTATQFQDVHSAIDRTTLAGKRDYAMLALMANNGLRDIEIHRANIEDLRNCGQHIVLAIQGKGGNAKDQATVIQADVERAIRDYLNARAESDLTAPLFVSDSNHAKGERLTTRSISRIVKNAFAKVGIISSRLTAHSLRHTGITIACEETGDIRTVSNYARHADISTTAIYDHSLNEIKASHQCTAAVAKVLFQH